MPSNNDEKIVCEESKLNEVCKIIKSGIKEFKGTKFYVDTGCVSESIIVEKNPVSYYDRPSRANMQTQIDDVLLAKMKNTKKVFLITKKEQDYLYSTGFAVLRPNKQRISPKYLFQYLLTRNFQDIKDDHCAGSTQKAINNDNLQNLPLRYPKSLDSQEKIAIKLDKIIELKTREKYCSKIFSEFILSTFFRMFGNTSPKKGWNHVPLKKIVLGNPQNGLFKKNNLYGTGTRIAWVENITPLCILDHSNLKRVPLTGEERNKFKTQEGEILVTRSSHLGVSGVGVMNVIPNLDEDVIFESHIMKIKLNEKLASPYYICAYFQTDEGRNEIAKKTKGATMASINQPGLLNMEVKLPPIEHQLNFESIIKRSNLVNKKLSKLDEKMNFLFNSLQTISFNGK